LIKTYYRLTKPGIIYGNLVSTVAGFLLASHLHVNFYLFIATLLGTALIIGSACVLNNIMDRDIDSKMERTRARAMVKGSIPIINAVVFAIILGLLGSAMLILFVNILTFIIGLVGFFSYVVLYTPIKKRSVYGTLVGSISGATPPVAGYCAVTGRFDTAALLLFIILVVWQMPHFYAIAIYRLKDYASAKIPVLPVKKGIPFTKITMTGYIILFILATIVLKFAGFAGYTYLAVMLITGISWFAYMIKGFKVKDDSLWARKMFRYSLIVLLAFCVTISVSVLLP